MVLNGSFDCHANILPSTGQQLETTKTTTTTTKLNQRKYKLFPFSSHFSSFLTVICCLSVVLQLDEGDCPDYASVVWDGCSDVLIKRLNSLHRRAIKLILPDTTLTTDQKLKEMRIMSLQKQLEYNKRLFMNRVLSNEAPEYISNLYTLLPSLSLDSIIVTL